LFLTLFAQNSVNYRIFLFHAILAVRAVFPQFLRYWLTVAQVYLILYLTCCFVDCFKLFVCLLHACATFCFC